MTSDVEYTDDEREFLAAVAAHKKRTGKPFLAYSEVLAVAVALGYRRVAEPGPMSK